MFQIVIDNLVLVGLMLGLYLLFSLSNIALGIYHNCNLRKQKFDFKRLLFGFLEVIVIGIGVFSLTVGASLLPVIFKKAQITIISDEVMQGISVLVILGIIAIGVINYANKCIQKLRTIFDKDNIENGAEIMDGEFEIQDTVLEDGEAENIETVVEDGDEE